MRHWVRATVMFVAACAAGGAAAQDRPNIVVVLADDMGMSDLGCYGGEIRTRYLDELAASGLRFTRMYNNNKCTPTRAALLTGVQDAVSLNVNRISADCATVADLLGGAGYAAYIVGKWHLASKGDRSQWPLQRGFQRFYGTVIGAGSYWAPATLRMNNENATADCDSPGFYLTDAISQNAAWMIEATPAEQPIFLYVAYTAPHWPLHAWPEDIDRYRGAYSEGWDVIRQRRFERMKKLGVLPEDAELSPRDSLVPAWEDEPHREWQERRMEVYAAQVERMDRGIGRIVETLKATGRMDNTLFLFLMDNGPCAVEYEPDRRGAYQPEKTRDGRPVVSGNLPDVMPGPEDTYQSYGRGWANVSATPFRLYKEYCHEGGILTPMIAHWPIGLKTEPGAVTDQVGHVMDLVPTFLEMAGVRHPWKRDGRELARLDGESLLPVLRGEQRPGHDVLFWRFASGAAIRRGPWKLVHAERTGRWTLADVWQMLTGGVRGPWELYDVDDDPTELHDLAKRDPARARGMKSAWRKWAKAHPAP